MPVSGLFQGSIAPKEFDTIELLSTPAKPTKVVWKQSGKTVREIKITYEGSTENIETVEVTV